MADAPKHSIAFVGIDIGKNSFHVRRCDSECHNPRIQDSS